MVQSIFGGAVDELSYTLRAGDHKESDLVVGGFRAREGLSILFEWEIDVAIDIEAIPTLEDVLGKDAEFRILRDEEPVRIVRGIIEEVRPQSTNGRQSHVKVILVPRLAELQHVTNSRIFQSMSVDQIVEALFKPYGGIESYWRVPRPEKREYRVQKNETDYDFLCRILADAGIHFHFQHDDKKTQIVFSDDPKGYDPISGDPKLPYRGIGGAVTVDHIGDIKRVRRIRPGKVATRDFDYLRPFSEMDAAAEIASPHDAENAPRRYTYVYPGDYKRETRDTEGAANAKRHLEQERSDAFVFHGKTSCVRVGVGKKFKLDDHPDDLYEREYLVTGVVLEGHRGGVFAETGKGKSGPGFALNFTAVPSNTPLRPARSPRPPTPPETAKVTGPNTGTPHVDAYGRVKVQFYWDRDGQWNEESSCWLRVMTPSAGSDRGIWFPPRVGDEVVVMYFDGDIDRPFVAGAMYNASETQEYHPVTDHYSKSTIRTRTVPFNGKGFNEITLDDLAGKEEIYLHAQRNLRETILVSHSENIGATQTTNVGAAQTINVGAMRIKNVGGNEESHIGLNRTETVGQKETVTIGMSRDHTITTGHDVLTVHNGTRQVDIMNGNHITGTMYLTRFAQKNMEIDSREDCTISVDRAIHAGETAGKAGYKIEAGKIDATGPKGISIQNEAQQINLAEKKISLIATDTLVLQCGNSSITLNKDGSIAIEGTKGITLTCQQSKVTLDTKSSTIGGNTATITAKGICNVSGAFVKIN